MMMNIIQKEENQFIIELNKLIALLPNRDEIQHVCSEEAEAEFILITAFDSMKAKHLEGKDVLPAVVEEAFYLLECLVDKCWERIHTGHFSEVPLQIRKVYAIASYFKIFYRLLDSSQLSDIEQCNEILDDAMLIGCTQNLYERNGCLQQELSRLFDATLYQHRTEQRNAGLPILKPLIRQNYGCDVAVMDCPSIEHFRIECFDRQQPALLLNTINHWPAMEKWRDLNYILNAAGNRKVPIEIGSNYAMEEWSQEMMKVRDFLYRQFSAQETRTTKNIEYLAQHELFDQIASLKADIRIPDYCTLGLQTPDGADIKAWLGPSGTISPLHFDPKHNLLCQVFGSKKIILADPADSANLYPHETKFLANTSQVNAEQPNAELHPKVQRVRFYHVTLQEGDCLYIPPKWWHYVRALSESFSVSFWWGVGVSTCID